MHYITIVFQLNQHWQSLILMFSWSKFYLMLMMLKKRLKTRKQPNFAIDVIKTIIRADRVDNWKLRLAVTQESLPIFAAAGHFNYTKSNLHIYIRGTYSILKLQRMMCKTALKMVMLLYDIVTDIGRYLQMVWLSNNFPWDP